LNDAADLAGSAALLFLLHDFAATRSLPRGAQTISPGSVGLKMELGGGLGAAVSAL